MTTKLYYWPKSSAMRVWWALEELAIPYELVLLAKQDKEHKAAPYLAINPNGQVPALHDDGTNIFESLAINLHLAEKYGVSRGLWPEVGSPNAAEALTWIVWGTVTLEPPTLQMAFHAAASELHLALPKDKRVPAIAEAAEADIHKRVAILEQRLTGRDYTLGSAFSIADIGNVTIIARVRMCKVDLSADPNVNAWMARCTARPAFKRVMPET
jgi:glutathione S-transferase